MQRSTTPLEPDWLGLSGRSCVVTGAGSGIGAEIAHQLARSGARVAVLDIHGEAAQAVATAITQAGGHAVAMTTDVSDATAVAAAAASLEQAIGTCEVLVNNAALIRYAGPLMGADVGLWNQMLAVNLTGALLCAQAFAGRMLAAGRGGSIVNLASICGHLPLPQGGAYSVGKAGLLMLTQLLAVELSGKGIRCNSVSPGLVRTPATEVSYQNPSILEGRVRLVPAGRIASPQDIAEAVLFLASERSAYISGQDLLVDGALAGSLMAQMPRAGAVPTSLHPENTKAAS